MLQDQLPIMLKHMLHITVQISGRTDRLAMNGILACVRKKR